MKNTVHLPIRVDPDTKRMAVEMAESLGISVSAYIRMLIRLEYKRESIDTKRRKG